MNDMKIWISVNIPFSVLRFLDINILHFKNKKSNI